MNRTFQINCNGTIIGLTFIRESSQIKIASIILFDTNFGLEVYKEMDSIVREYDVNMLDEDINNLLVFEAKINKPDCYYFKMEPSELKLPTLMVPVDSDLYKQTITSTIARKLDVFSPVLSDKDYNTNAENIKQFNGTVYNHLVEFYASVDNYNDYYYELMKTGETRFPVNNFDNDERVLAFDKLNYREQVRTGLLYHIWQEFPHSQNIR